MTRLRWKQIFSHSLSSMIVGLAIFGGILLLIPETNNAPLGTLLLVLLFLFIIALVVGIISGFKFSQNIITSLEEFGIGARHLAYGDLSYRLPFSDDPELGDMATAFNDMADRIENQVAILQRLAAENEVLIQQTKATAITEERQRLARDLHDAVSQQLFAISMISATAAKMVTHNPAKCAILIKDIEDAATKAQAEMRALILQLRPVTLQNEKLIDAIHKLAQELKNKQSIDYQLELTDIELSTNIENQLYRITQEGLSNILRHAQANKIKIKLFLSKDKRRLTLSIEDNGQGFLKSEVPKTSFGIKSIKERALAIGGTAQWISLPGKGTRLEVRIPLINIVEEKT